jgi:hypothetical protein
VNSAVGNTHRMGCLLTDHFHPLFRMNRGYPNIHYFPKGYLSPLSYFCRPSVVTIHGTIILCDADPCIPESAWDSPGASNRDL